MTRDLILMSGEYNVTMPLVFKRDRWWHSMKNLDVVIADDGTFSYGAMSGEELSSISLQELPTQRARAGLSYNETCTNVIKDIDIFDEYLKRQGVEK